MPADQTPPPPLPSGANRAEASAPGLAEPPQLRLAQPVLLVLTMTLLGVFAFESLKALLQPQLTARDSELLSMLFSGLVATVAAGIVLRKQHRLILGLSQEAAKRRQAEQTARRNEETADAANRAKSEYLAHMSHEIRTPLNGVLGMIELALDTDLTPDQHEYLRMAQLSAGTLLTVISDVLDFSKIEAGKIELETIPFDLERVLSDTVQAFLVSARAKRLQLSWNVSPEIPATLAGDPARLRQILVNLVGNALKFTEQGQVEVRAALEPRNEDGQPLCVHFSVRDTGIGIPAEHRSHLFEAFSQADRSTARRFGGTGLGLAICARLSALMGGRMWLDSEPGRGSQFHVTLPFALPSEPAPGVPPPVTTDSPAPSKPAEEPDSAMPGARNLRILLAEDDAINAHVVIGLLRGEGHALVVAKDGLEAVGACEQGPFDLILMDIQMPRMDGMEATRRIRERERSTGGHIPILALTANAVAGQREQYLAAGMDDYLSKPVRFEALQTAVNRWAKIGGGASGNLRAARPARPQAPAGGCPEALQRRPALLASPPTRENRSRLNAAPESEPDLAPEALVDFGQLMEMADHRPDRYRELAGLYLAQTAQHLQALGKALAAGALPEARRLAHKCTGASATCGMVSMLQPLEAVERLSAEGRPQEANRALAEAGHTLERLRHCLTDHWSALSVPSQEKLSP